MIIGLVVGATKSVEDHRRARAAYEGCVAERLGMTETSVHNSAR
jgi:hypothetical protein